MSSETSKPRQGIYVALLAVVGGAWMRRIVARFVVVVSFALISPSIAAAQCSALLKGGVFESTTVTNDSTSTQSFMNWVRSHHTDTSSSSADGGVSIPVVGSLSGSEQQYRQIEADYAASQRGNSAAAQHLEAHIKSVSAALAAEFTKCMQTKGLHVWLEVTNDPATFKIAAMFNSPGNPATAKVTEVNISPSDVTCTGTIRGTLGGSTRRAICHRNQTKAVTVAINADEDPVGGADLNLGAVKECQDCNKPTVTCEKPSVLASRGAEASHPRLTDGTISNSIGVNSGHKDGSFFVNLARPEWIHHIILYPISQGSDQTQRIIGTDADGKDVELFSIRSFVTGGTPLNLPMDLSKSKNIKKITVNTTSENGRDWVAWSEWEIFTCR